MTATGASGQVGVSSNPAGAPFSAPQTNVSWIKITGTSAAGVAYAVDANPALTARSGAIAIAGQTFNVVQAGAQPVFAIAPASAQVPATGASGQVGVSSTPPGAAFGTAQASAPWVRITGTTTSAVNYSVDANTTQSTRSASISVAGQSFSVTQAAAKPDFVLAPASAQIPAAGGTQRIAITWNVNSQAVWQAVSNAPSWIFVTSYGSDVNISVLANPASTTRTGTLTIMGQTFTVTQAGR